MNNGNQVRWGILGSGRIARAFVEGAQGSTLGTVAAIASRDPSRPAADGAFGEIPIVAGYEAVLRDPAIDAVYIALPHPLHAEWGIKAARSGKHVLCEKPFAMSSTEAEAMFAAAAGAGVLMAEAFMYRVHPLTRGILDVLNRGAIGEIRLIHSSFGFNMPMFLPEHRLLSKALGGGAVLDLGGYPVSMVRLLASHATPARMLEPVEVKAVGRIGATGVDEWASASLRFENGIVATLSVSLAAQQDNVLRVFGSQGRLEVDDFWFGTGRLGGTKQIKVIDNQGRVTAETIEEPRHVYTVQFDALNRSILSGARELEYPGMNARDTIGNMAVLDRWLVEIGYRS